MGSEKSNEINDLHGRIAICAQCLRDFADGV
jgi:hypothetical protein